MRVFGFEITRTKAPPSSLENINPGRGWSWGYVIGEAFTGAWQRNIEARPETVLTFSTIYACITLISSDVGKLRIKLVEQTRDGVWEETSSPAFSRSSESC